MKLIDLEDAAKAAGKGKWSKDAENGRIVRNIKWNVENPRNFVDSFHHKPVEGKRVIFAPTHFSNICNLKCAS